MLDVKHSAMHIFRPRRLRFGPMFCHFSGFFHLFDHSAIWYFFQTSQGFRFCFYGRLLFRCSGWKMRLTYYPRHNSRIEIVIYHKTKTLKVGCTYHSSFVHTRFCFIDCGREVQNRGFAIPKISGGNNVRNQLTVSIIFRSLIF